MNSLFFYLQNGHLQVLPLRVRVYLGVIGRSATQHFKKIQNRSLTIRCTSESCIGHSLGYGLTHVLRNFWDVLQHQPGYLRMSMSAFVCCVCLPQPPPSTKCGTTLIFKHRQMIFIQCLTSNWDIVPILTSQLFT